MVSKTWFSIISSHHFSKSHLETAPKDDGIVIVHHRDGDEDNSTFSLFHLDSVHILENLKVPYSHGEFPYHIDLDFKVVRVVSRSVSSSISTSAEVYSSNKNSWRKIESKPSNTYHYRDRFDVCFHGFLFVIGRKNCMTAFKLNKEFLIWDINLPDGSFNDATRSIEVLIQSYSVVFHLPSFNKHM